MVNFEQGDIIIMDFIPQQGHEQSQRSPAIVISNNILNQHSSLVFVCPITDTNKNHPFHIALDGRTQTTGVILCDQARILDIKTQNVQFREKCPTDIWNEAKELIISFL